MAEATEQRAVATAFAPPPPLWKYFTQDNIDALETIKKEALKKNGDEARMGKHWSPAELRSLDVPPELRFLIPPELPTGEYTVFGESQTLSTTLPSLKEQGIEQLYPEPGSDTDQASSQPNQPLNHAYYLLKISKSLLLNFLEFVGILSVSPEQYESKVEDLRNLFINAHHLLNLYRPHQARESLIMMMEEQLKRTREEITKMDEVKSDIENLMNQLEAEGQQLSRKERLEDTAESTPKPGTISEDTKLVWRLLGRVD
ncbi:Mediator of RNA polymerase II transcription subunit 7 [Penicillium ucsense]|uniref:Mediator of RNA polymerase II transcription subunit 7 n=1 Tax=Penicillium ucsense TaxID=2839758 RepID=A0A8J8VZI0_9EURO|nr:Mediator of RNA polymerase II transcription subunit 7 [Penicillium ucsense]KAF7736728.1 Mediator of RNA polymerase II transcription subunit 7 [Penicillium ucsense]